METGLCPQSRLYLVLSLIVFLVLVFQNFGNIDYYCLGRLQCEAPDLTMIFIIKVLYISFWTLILQMLCAANQGTLAWILVLYPILLYIILFIDMLDG